MCVVSWIGGCAKSGLLPSKFKVKTKQSGIPRTGLGVSPMQTRVWAVGDRWTGLSVTSHQQDKHTVMCSSTSPDGSGICTYTSCIPAGVTW